VLSCQASPGTQTHDVRLMFTSGDMLQRQYRIQGMPYCRSAFLGGLVAVALPACCRHRLTWTHQAGSRRLKSSRTAGPTELKQCTPRWPPVLDIAELLPIGGGCLAGPGLMACCMCVPAARHMCECRIRHLDRAITRGLVGNFGPVDSRS